MGGEKRGISCDIILDLSDTFTIWDNLEIILDKSAPSEMPVMWALYSLIEKPIFNNN